ncbi:peptidyl-prolyl cis-trans isomerase [Halovulum sp. GXIMD14794]
MLRRILSEPLLHFLLIGVAVFAAFEAFDDTAPVQTQDVIEVTDAQVDLFESQFASVWNRPPTEQEMSALIEEHIREEVYYREALALGLDSDDAVIRRRLRQKMEFLTEPPADALSADDNALRAFYDANAELFRSPPAITFEQVFLGDEDPETALEMLRSGAGPEAVGPPSMLPPGLQNARRAAVDGTYGAGFFDALLELPVGAWDGPVTSGYGQHLVRIAARQDADLPPFEDIRTYVEAEWQKTEATRLRDEIFDELRKRYTVVRPEADPAS